MHIALRDSIVLIVLIVVTAVRVTEHSCVCMTGDTGLA